MISKDEKGRYKTKTRKHEESLFYIGITQDETTRTKVRKEKILDTVFFLYYDSEGDERWNGS